MYAHMHNAVKHRAACVKTTGMQHMGPKSDMYMVLLRGVMQPVASHAAQLEGKKGGVSRLRGHRVQKQSFQLHGGFWFALDFSYTILQFFIQS